MRSVSHNHKSKRNTNPSLRREKKITETKKPTIKEITEITEVTTDKEERREDIKSEKNLEEKDNSMSASSYDCYNR
jgi:hypothetical protein